MGDQKKPFNLFKAPKNYKNLGISIQYQFSKAEFTPVFFSRFKSKITSCISYYRKIVPVIEKTDLCLFKRQLFDLYVNLFVL